MPPTLSEQLRARVRSGRLRVLVDEFTEGPFAGQALGPDGERSWSALIMTGDEIAVSSHPARTIVRDFEDYICGYAAVMCAGKLLIAEAMVGHFKQRLQRNLSPRTSC